MRPDYPTISVPTGLDPTVIGLWSLMAMQACGDGWTMSTSLDGVQPDDDDTHHPEWIWDHPDHESVCMWLEADPGFSPGLARGSRHGHGGLCLILLHAAAGDAFGAAPNWCNRAALNSFRLEQPAEPDLPAAPDGEAWESALIGLFNDDMPPPSALAASLPFCALGLAVPAWIASKLGKSELNDSLGSALMCGGYASALSLAACPHLTMTSVEDSLAGALLRLGSPLDSDLGARALACHDALCLFLDVGTPHTPRRAHRI